MTTPSTAGIDIEGVHVAYGEHPVLADVNLAIAPGEFFALLGPSGSGKSTLLRLIAGFNVAQRGRVLIAGDDVGASAAVEARRRHGVPELRPVSGSAR